MALEDFGALLRSGSAAVTDYADQEAKRQLLQIKGLEQKRLYEEQQREVAEEQTFQSDLTSVLANPSAQGYAALIAKHPKAAAGLKSSWDMMDGARQKADLLSGSEIYSAAAGGKYDLAATLLQRRIDADKAAGHPPDPHDQTILDGLKSGDPTQQKAAMGMIGYGLAAVAGPDKFASTLGELTKASTPEIRSVEAGGSVAERNPVTGAWEEKYRSPYLKTADGGVLVADGEGGGQTSPGVAATAAPGGPGGFDAAVEHVLQNEGGYAPSDMNGQPVNFGINQGANPGVDVKNLTRDQAKQIYHDKYWVPSGAENLPSNLQAPYFDVYIRNPKFAKKALAQSGGDPVKFMEASQAYFQKLGTSQSGQKYAKAWANRDAKNMAIATGGSVPASTGGAPGSQTPAAPPGYRWLTPPKPKDAPAGYAWGPNGNLVPIAGGPADKPTKRRMTPAEVAAEGLDPNIVYYRGEDGVPQAVSGQDKRTGGGLKPWPPTALNARSTNEASVKNIDRALALLDPNNQSEDAKQARYAIGPSNAVIPDAVLQQTNPKGTGFRALVGQIGGVIIKDISGAAVSASEDERLKKWVPRVSDTPSAAAAKLRNLRNEIVQRNQAMDEAFSEDQGFRPFSAGGGGARVRIRSVQEYNKLAPGTPYFDPKGIPRVKH